MRWERLFDDLEGQAAAAETLEAEAEIAERSRAEHGRLQLADRLRAAEGHPLTLTIEGAGTLSGVLRRTGVDWLLLGGASESEVLVRLGAMSSVVGLGSATAPARDHGAVAAAFDLRKVLRGLARDRSSVRMVLTDGTVVTGTLDRAAADYVELAEHEMGEPRRAGAVRAVRTIRLAAIAVVSRVR